MTTTGRLNSQNPNLQNIPIRTERGQEIRKAFVPRSTRSLLLSADYSQIELRIIAALSKEAGLLEAFRRARMSIRRRRPGFMAYCQTWLRPRCDAKRRW